MLLVSLVFRNLTARRTRTLLTGFAIAASVALVVAMTSGIAAFQNSASGFMDRFMGVVDATVTAPLNTGGVPDSVAADPAPRPRRAAGDGPHGKARRRCRGKCLTCSAGR